MGILIAILEDDVVEGNSSSSEITSVVSVVEKLDSYVLDLSDAEIAKLACFLKDWNTNAKNCFVAQSLINSLFRVVKVDRLKGIKELGDIFQALEVYSERHYQRIDRLQQGSYLLEYIASLMRLLPNTSDIDIKRGSTISTPKFDQFEDSFELDRELLIFGSASESSREDVDSSSEGSVNSDEPEDAAVRKRKLKTKSNGDRSGSSRARSFKKSSTIKSDVR